MAEDIVMPRLSDSMEEGTVLHWMKQVGEEVSVGEELAEIETDKANMTYEVDAAGTVIEILAREGETLPIGAVIARVGDRDEAPAADGDDGDGRRTPVTTTSQGSRIPAATTSTLAAPSRPGTEHGNGRVRASPLARRIATERGIDVSQLAGSGPGGRIIKADVEHAEDIPARRPPAAPAPATTKGAVEVTEPNRLQQTIARRMAESKATAPHFYLRRTADMGRSVEARSHIKQAAKEMEVVPSFNDMVVKAAALALRKFPRANAAYRNGRFELYERINIGVAVASSDALVVPTIFDADQKGLRQIAVETRELARKVREGRITPPELSGGTFTVSNLGMYGISGFHAVINPGQAAILAVGEIAERPVIRDGELTAAHLMDVTLACDHRILYGVDGAEFLASAVGLLEEPVGLAL